MCMYIRVCVWALHNDKVLGSRGSGGLHSAALTLHLPSKWRCVCVRAYEVKTYKAANMYVF
jgi:hypothetical protein